MEKIKRSYFYAYFAIIFIHCCNFIHKIQRIHTISYSEQLNACQHKINERVNIICDRFNLFYYEGLLEIL